MSRMKNKYNTCFLDDSAGSVPYFLDLRAHVTRHGPPKRQRRASRNRLYPAGREDHLYIGRRQSTSPDSDKEEIRVDIQPFKLLHQREKFEPRHVSHKFAFLLMCMCCGVKSNILKTAVDVTLPHLCCEMVKNTTDDKEDVVKRSIANDEAVVAV
ncbi:hypothetical protein TNCV_1129301 [Trichonephila clavipes]|nr:hypothetical protein TNCV_1129301 [Trichonephila clavipes]